MNDIFEVLLQKIKSFPGLRVESEAGLLKVLPQYGDGFPVALEERAYSYIVRFDSWRIGFGKDEDSVSSVINLFLFGLSPNCRVKVYDKGGIEYQWDVECKRDNEWITASCTRRYSPSSNVSTEIKYYQNHIDNIGDLTHQFLNIINESNRKGANFVFTMVSLFVIGICIKAFPATGMLFPGYIVSWVLVKIAVDSWYERRIKLLTNPSVATPIRCTKAHYYVLSWLGLWALMIFALRWKYGNDALILCLGFWPFILILFLLPIFFVVNRIR